LQSQLHENDQESPAPINKKKNITKTDLFKEHSVLRNRSGEFIRGSRLSHLIDFGEEAIDVGAHDPSLGEGRQTAKTSLGAYLQASRNAKQSLARMSHQAADVNVVSRKRPAALDRLRERYEPRKNERHNTEEQLMQSDADEDPIFKEAKSAVDAKKAARKENVRNKALKHLPPLETELQGKRSTNYAINKNKGLTRKRKKYEGNARVHNRMKFEKKIKNLKGFKPSMRSGGSSGGYEGESTGIRANIMRSKTIT